MNIKEGISLYIVIDIICSDSSKIITNINIQY